jgi:DME family drug/metabolite transporter
LVALGAAPTAVAYTSYFRALRSVSATTAALVTVLEPLTGTVLAAVLLRERLGWAGTVGAMLLGAAVFLAAWTRAGSAGTDQAASAVPVAPAAMRSAEQIALCRADQVGGS